jgi:hypothetical protein
VRNLDGPDNFRRLLGFNRDRRLRLRRGLNEANGLVAFDDIRMVLGALNGIIDEGRVVVVGVQRRTRRHFRRGRGSRLGNRFPCRARRRGHPRRRSRPDGEIRAELIEFEDAPPVLIYKM